MSEPVIRFRNYVPKSADLKEAVVAKPAPPSVQLASELSLVAAGGGSGAGAPAPAPGGAAPGPSFVGPEGAAGDLGSFVGILRGTTSLDPVSIAPKKENWDLKRDTEKRLLRLERQTQAAIRDLIRQRLAEEGKGEEEKDVAEVVGAHTGAVDYDSDE